MRSAFAVLGFLGVAAAVPGMGDGTRVAEHPEDIVIEHVESITVSDVADLMPPAAIVITESIAVSDAPDLMPPTAIVVSERIVVTDGPDNVSASAPLVVNATDDPDPGTCDPTHCSLREAILTANATPAPDEIHFAIPGSGPHTIRPASALPTIEHPVLIDGYTQVGATPNTNGPEQGSNAVLMVVLDGIGASGGIGLNVGSDAVTIRGLVVQRFSFGIALSGSEGRIEGSLIRRNPGDGIFVTGSGNEIGGATAAARNVISGNSVGVAIFPGATGNLVRGNLIGTAADGTTIVANALDGVAVGGSGNRVGGAEPGEGNVIAPHSSNAVLVGWWGEGNPLPRDNVVQGNTIGSLAAGQVADVGQGVSIADAVGTLVGGTAPEAGNVIRGNGFNGVAVTGSSASGNRILSNSISDNGELGIDLGTHGVTPNDDGDLDDGPNRLQNFPVLTNVLPGLGVVTLAGHLESTLGRRFTIQFYVGACDASGHGEAERLVGEASVTTDRRGLAVFEEVFDVSVPYNTFATATATDPDGNTSELSRCRPSALTVIVTGDQEVLAEPLDDGGTLISSSGGTLFSTIEVCGVTTLSLTDGDRLELRCGSAGIVVLDGPVEVRLDENTEAVVPADGVVTVEESEDGGPLQIANQSPAGSEPVQLVVDGRVAGELSAGASLDVGTLHVATAELRAGPGGGASGRVELVGTFTPGPSGDGIDALREDVAIALGPFDQTFPAGAFRRDRRTGGWKYESDGTDGFDEVKIGADGSFKVEGRGLDLEGLDLSQPVPLALRIGNDLGSFAIPFGEDGEYRAPAAVAGALEFAGDEDLGIRPGRITVAAGATAALDVRVGARFAGQAVSLACEGLPHGAECVFQPTTLFPTEQGAVARLTVLTTGWRAAGAAPPAGRGWPRLPPVWFGGLLALAVLGLGLTAGRAVPRARRVALPLALLIAAGLFAAACGDDPTGPGRAIPTPAGTHVFTVTATAGEDVYAADVTMTVTCTAPACVDQAPR